MSRDSWFALPLDVNQWQTVILSNLARKVPEIVSSVAGIDFSKIDPVIGDADGLIFLIGGMAAIPITVRGNKLAPLSVMVDKKENFYPVNETFIQKIYADNVIGEPSNEPNHNEDFAEEGPGQQVKYYNTIGAESRLKTASYEDKANLLSQIEKSAKLLTFFHNHSPETLEELYSSKPDEPEKIASAPEDLPELMFLLKDDRGYSFNGERVSIGDAASFMKIAGLSNEQKAGVMNGGHICLDYREKHASVGFEAECGSCDSTENPDQASSYIATVLDADSVPHKGFLHRESSYQTVNNHSSKSYQFLFIGDDFYAVQDDVKILSRVPVEIKHLRESSSATDPEVGLFGVVMSDYSISKPMTINSVQKYGNVTIVKSLGFGMETEEFELGKGQLFYTIPEEAKSLLRNSDSSMLSTTGFNYTLGIDGDGNVVLDGKADSQANTVYSLMNKFAMDYEDAVKIASEATERGRVMFKVAAPTKATKQAPVKNAKPDVQGVTPSGQTPQIPVNQRDLEDVAAMNDPSLMDAYITGRLTDVNTAGREQLMHASDALLGAIKAVGRILFLVRVGKLDYVKEEDAQLCLNKLSDVARSIGVASSQLI